MALENMIEATVLLPSVNLRKCAGKFSCACQVITIQIKICAEYRDMLPRPRLVCQEPDKCVPDKSSRCIVL